MKSVDHFFDKIGASHKRFVVSSALALQALLTISADIPPNLNKQEALSLRKITEYWREGNFHNAKTHILDFFNSFPESSYSSELHAMLGDLYFQEKTYELAAKSYASITSPPIRELIALRYMESLFHLGQYEELVLWSQRFPIKKEDNEEKYSRFLLLRAESLYRTAVEMQPGEKQKKTVYEALAVYEKISYDPSHHAAIAIAHLHALAEESDKAADLYQELAKAIPEQREEFYFRAATQISSQNPERALDFFQKALDCRGSLLSSSIFNRLTILYKQKNYAQFLEEYDRYSASLDAGHASSLLFCRGIALFQLDRFGETVTPLMALLHLNTLTPLQTRQALLSLFFCAQRTNDLALIDDALQKWSAGLPLDDGYLRGLFVKSQIALQKKEASIASTTLSEILERFPDCEERELVLFDYAQSLALAEKWSEARTAFQRYLREYTSSSSTPLAWQHLIYCSMQLLKDSGPAEKEGLKGCLLLDLQAALLAEPPLDQESMRLYRRGSAQLYFELGQQQEALAQAEIFMKAYPQDPDAQTMRLMTAACHVMLGSAPQAFITVAEEALVQETDPTSQSRLHLQLFNAYLARSQEKSDDTANFLEKAADHLLVIYQAKTTVLKQENLLWLADYLIKKQTTTSQAIAVAILEEALPFQNDELILNEKFNAELLESYTLRLASLYEQQNRLEKASQLLSSLIRLADTQTEAFWQQRRCVLFTLAELEEKLGRGSQALALYTQLIDEAAYASSSYYRRAALLKRAELQYSALPLEEKQNESASLLAILDTLKELQITKNIHSEPIHLEAALDYASMRSGTVSASEQANKLLFYLEKLKEDFNSQVDDVALHYHEERQKSAEQDVLFCAYMRYIDIEMKRVTALMKRESGDHALALLLEQEIQKECKEILALPTMDKSPLALRIQRSLELIPHHGS